MDKFIAIFNKLEKAMMFLAFVFITLMMLLISADTIGRYVFSKPITGTNEIVTIYLIVAVVYLGLSNTLKHNEHISIDFFVNKLSTRIREVLLVITNLLGAILFLVIFYQSWLVTYKAFMTSESFVGVITFPMYPAYGLVPLGSLFLFVRLLLNLYMLFKNKNLE